jgi:hypothetical protein
MSDEYTFSETYDDDVHSIEIDSLHYEYDIHADCLTINSGLFNLTAWREIDDSVTCEIDLAYVMPVGDDMAINYVSIDTAAGIPLQFDTHGNGFIIGLTNPETGEAGHDSVIIVHPHAAFVLGEPIMTQTATDDGEYDYAINAMDCFMTLVAIEDMLEEDGLADENDMAEFRLVKAVTHNAKKNRKLMQDAYDFVKSI